MKLCLLKKALKRAEFVLVSITFDITALKDVPGRHLGTQKAPGRRPVSTTPLVIAWMRYGATVFLRYSALFITVSCWSYFLLTLRNISSNFLGA
jgi:hypothetical protein